MEHTRSGSYNPTQSDIPAGTSLCGAGYATPVLVSVLPNLTLILESSKWGDGDERFSDSFVAVILGESTWLAHAGCKMGPDQGNGVEYSEPRTVNAPGSLFWGLR